MIASILIVIIASILIVMIASLLIVIIASRVLALAPEASPKKQQTPDTQTRHDCHILPLSEIN